MSTKMQKCALYIRVSTSEQMVHGKSLEAQESSLRNYAADHGMAVVGVYADKGKTARKELKKRKAIHSLLADVKRGKIDVIIFWRLDRWFRNMSDFYKVQDILDEYKVTWISISEPGINMETRDGRLQLNVVLSIGQNEVDTTSERIRFVNEASIRQGKLIFGDANMPLGYKADIVGGVKRMVKDEKTAHMVEAFFQYYKVHQNKSATVKYMQDTFGIPFSYSMLRTMLSSEFYKGTYRGCPYCPAYLTDAEYEEIQTISQRNIRRPRSDRTYYFSGLIHCPECGQILVGSGSTMVSNRKTGTKKTYCYYRCNRCHIDKICSFKYRPSQILLEEYLLNNLEWEFQKYTARCKEIKEVKRKTAPRRSSDKIQKEIDRLNFLFQKDRITWDHYDAQYQELEKELNELESYEAPPVRDLSYINGVLNSDFRSDYDRLTPENKQAFWRSIIKEISITSDGAIKHVDFL